MKTSILFSLLGSAALSLLTLASASDVADTIVSNASADDVDLSALPNFDAALDEIVAVYENAGTTPTSSKRDFGCISRRQTPSPNNIVDVHTHVVPSWYQSLVPITGQNPTPSWDLATHLSFMTSEGISHSVIGFSAPGPNVYQGDKRKTLALARIMNEQVAAYCRTNPKQLSFYAVVPLPYTAEAINEANYALDNLGAVGIILTSNVEGLYLGNAQFKPFFDAINKRQGRQILYIHPGTPYLKVGDTLYEANPTLYATGNIEFYFETARTLMDLTLTQTIHNFTNIHYVIPHVGGAFTTSIDRILKSVPPLYDSSMQIYSTRFWWDSAGPTYFHQVAGLLGFTIPKSQYLFGTDYPYAPSFTQAGSLGAVKASTLFTDAEKTAIFSGNAKNLFGDKIQFY